MQRRGCVALCRLCRPDAGVRLLHSSRVLQLKKKVVPLPAFFRPPSASAEAAAAALPPPPSPSIPLTESSSSPSAASGSAVSASASDSDSAAAAARAPVVRHFGQRAAAAGGSRSAARPRPSAIASSRRADDRADDAAWDWKMGIIVERMPLILNPPLPWQLQWEEMQRRDEERQALPIPADLRPARADDEAAPALAPTLTAADAAGDLQSRDRSLNRALYLLLKRRNGHTGEERWTLPAVDFTALPAASVLPRAAAHSAARAALGSDITVHPLGNAPVAYHRYDYSQQYRLKANTTQQGCKLFLFHALWCSGDVTLAAQAVSPGSASRYTEYAWASRAELPALLSHDERLLELLDDAMLEDALYVDESLSLDALQRRTEHRTKHLVAPFRSRHIRLADADPHLEIQ